MYRNKNHYNPWTSQANLENSILDKDKDLSSWKRLHNCNAKLNNAAEMTSLMAFFAVLATVELKITKEEAVPELLIALSVITSLLVAISMIIRVIICHIIPYLETASESYDVMLSPHEEMITIINCAWLVANIVNPILFIVDFIIMIWIKFQVKSIEATYCGLGILTLLVVAILIFGFVYSTQTIKPKTKTFVEPLKPNNNSQNEKHSMRIANSEGRLLMENPFLSYESYGSTLINPNPVLYFGFPS